MTKYGIFRLKKHDYQEQDKPVIARGWFDSPEEAKECLEKYYFNGDYQRYDNDVYGYHYYYWYEIYAFDTDNPMQFYDMDDYVRDLVCSGEWYKLSEEQRKTIKTFCRAHTLMWLAFHKKKDELQG